MSSIGFMGIRNGASPDVKRFASREDISSFSSGDMTCDIVLAEGASIAFSDNRPFVDRRNHNVIFLANSGAGKTYSGILPTLINHLPGSYVLTDTKGELYRATAEGFEADGYEVTRLDSIDLDKSAGFNPFAYVRSIEDIPVISKMVLEALNPNRNNTNDSIWPRCSEMCMESMVGILYEFETIDGWLSAEAGKRGLNQPCYLTMRNIHRLVDMINVAPDGADDVSSPIEYMIEALSSGNVKIPLFENRSIFFDPRPNCYGIRKYRDFTCGSERTVKSVVITLQADLAKTCTPEMERVLSRDDLKLDHIDERRRVIYLVMSDNDVANNFLGNLAFKMLVNVALKKADANHDGRLKIPLQIVADEFCNLGHLDGFERAISVMRSRDIGVILCVQSLSQLDYTYGEHGREVIMENCDSIVIMGTGSSIRTAQFASDLCGTVGVATKLLGIEQVRASVEERVLTPAAIDRLPREKCIVKISGALPFLTKKYDVRKHPNAKRFLNMPE